MGVKTAVCTITTKSHFFKSRSLLRSAHKHLHADLFCLVTDDNQFPSPVCGEIYHSLDVLSGSLAGEVKNKYTGNKLRWACKPLYMMYLLGAGYDKVIYVDNDICFFSSANFLFDELDNTSILLAPHFYPTDTRKDQHWLEANYRVGLYNAGFIGATSKGFPALEWWASCCLYNIKKSAWRGLFDDQKYLDLLPVIYDDVKVLKHKGCNVAGWNMDMCPRIEVDGQIYIDGRWPIVFIHFTPLTFRNILSYLDIGLSSYLEEYVNNLKKEQPQFTATSQLKRSLNDYLLYFRHIRWRIIRFFE